MAQALGDGGRNGDGCLGIVFAMVVGTYLHRLFFSPFGNNLALTWLALASMNMPRARKWTPFSLKSWHMLPSLPRGFRGPLS